MRRLFVVLILTMTATLSQAQNSNLLAEGRVDHLSYIAYKSDQIEGVLRIDVVKRDVDAGYVIRIERNDNIEYWYFNLKNARTENNILSAEIYSTASYNDYMSAYTDDRAYGTITSDRNSGIETLDFHFQKYGSSSHYILRWKAIPNNGNDSIHTYMRNRPVASQEEKQGHPLKKWGNKEAEELMNQIGYYPIGGWSLEGENSDGKYAYSLDFSPTGKVLFLYFTESEYQNGRFINNIRIAREGRFEIEGDIIEFNFTKLLGSLYNRPYLWHDPLEEDLSLRVRVELRVESYYDRELIITQVSGANIFENHPENETLTFTATILPPAER